MNNLAVIDEERYVDLNDRFSKSNFLITSKFRSSLLSNKLMAICLSRINTAIEDEAGALTVKIKGNEIQKILGVKGNNFFPQLDKAAHSMTGRSIGWSNPLTSEFEYTAVVTRATYKNGEFAMEFSKHMKKYLVDLNEHYTQFSLKLLCGLKSTYSFRLLELLRAKSFPQKDEIGKNYSRRVEFDLNELKLLLGVVNAELDSVQRVLAGSKRTPDYEKAVQASPEKVLESWYEFKRCCIDVAIKEINEQDSGIYVDYKPLKAGKGGKVHSIVFFVDVYNNKKAKISEKDKDAVLDDILDLIPDIRIKEARSIAEAGNYDISLIKEKIEMLNQSKNIENSVGWLISALKDNYPVQRKKKNSFSDFSQRKYDYDALEKEAFR